jgi:AMP-binding enzyme
VELGISAGAGLETDLRTARADASRRAVTNHILALADQAGYGAALIDAVAPGASEASVITWPQFARMIRTAADGLSRRGLRQDDTAGVLVHDAVTHVIAVHSIRAAGASATPVHAAHTAADIAVQLKQCRARLLVTSAELAGLAIEAAERSLVRQVFAFGEAEGTAPFGSLLHSARHGQPHPNGSLGHDGRAGRDGRGSPVDGDGEVIAQFPDLAGLGSDGTNLRLTSRDVVVAAPPCGDPDVYTSLLDLALAAGATIVAAPLAQVPAAVGAYKGTAAVVLRGTDVPGLPAGRVFAVG